MFETLTAAPPDAILGLTEAFKKDENPDKINLSVGVYQDASGTTPVLESVKEAERRLVETETTKAYMPISGNPRYGELVRRLLFGDDHEVVTSGRAATIHAPGGTGALRVAGDFLKTSLPHSGVWVSKPTWPNHHGVFTAAGAHLEEYPYFDAANNCLGFEEMLAWLKELQTGEVVLLHGCCHNPSGIDPTPEQWKQIGDVISERKLLPLVDFAYQGFADGIEQDAAGLREICRPGQELLVASSFSKNFGLYRERVGALTAVTADAAAAAVVMSRLKQTVRANYSNPPAHGGGIVATVLDDEELTAKWENEVAEMRDRINGMRQSFVDAMKERAPEHDFSFITQQRGMFSFSGLTPMQVDELRSKYSIYIVGSGRINVAGITPANLDRLCDAVAAVL
jgi:aspartate/tyrosine/aromatic aminotransferase